MSRPTDRTCELDAIGEIDKEGGEFWFSNPFAIVRNGENLSAYERNKLFMNVDGTEFFDASFASNVDIESDSRSAIGSDFDNDGDPDLLVASVGGGPLRLFENRFDRGNRFLKIELEGTTSNRRGVGARVVLTIADKKITRDLFPKNGSMGLAPVELLIGIGDATKIDEVTVRWPTGKIQTLANVDAGTSLKIKEE